MLTETEAPALPVSLEDLKSHVRYDDADDDLYLTGLIRAALRMVENATGRAFVHRAFRLTLDAFPDVIELPIRPLVSVQSVTYIDPDGVEQAADFQASNRNPPVVRPVIEWPETKDQLDAVWIDFTAGYDAVPEDVKHAILLLAGQWYERRESVESGSRYVSALPFTVDALLSPYRVLSC
jgi:uncharacterized phiE125 gp8 family phage protein